MVLYPLDTAENALGLPGKMPQQAGARQSVATVVSAWEAVERRQRQETSAWWLVAQSDHAALAGDLAAKISCRYLPRLEPEVINAIALHDAGWTQFDDIVTAGTTCGSFRTTAVAIPEAGRPRSFLDMSPPEFLIAWSDSIERAEESSAIGGVLVSQHFSRLAKSRLGVALDSPQDAQNLRSFVAKESQRQARLAGQSGFAEEQICTRVDVLQFCDLLSLYLCCGSQEDVEFPQRFEGHSVLARREGQMCRMEPAIFGTGVSLGVSARPYASTGVEPILTTLAFLLS